MVRWCIVLSRQSLCQSIASPKVAAAAPYRRTSSMSNPAACSSGIARCTASYAKWAASAGSGSCRIRRRYAIVKAETSAARHLMHSMYMPCIGSSRAYIGKSSHRPPAPARPDPSRAVAASRAS
jgi:hypothetical protein